MRPGTCGHADCNWQSPTEVNAEIIPYKIQMQQAFHEANKARRVYLCGNFKMFLEDNPAVSRSIWFSDETFIRLNGLLNNQNECVWASEHLHNIVETSLHPEKWKAWRAVPRS
jgi:hypothetical protein